MLFIVESTVSYAHASNECKEDHGDMAAYKNLAKPEDEDVFEQLCQMLYGEMWKDHRCVRMGRRGQGQGGVDIIGHHNGIRIGIQCKHYLKTKFTLHTVEDDVKKVEESGLKIAHLLFATSADNDAKVAQQVIELSDTREAAGKFSVSVDFWGDISGKLNLHQHVAQAFIQNFAGSPVLEARDNSVQILAIAKEGFSQGEDNAAQIMSLVGALSERVESLAPGATPIANGLETDPVVANKLDMVRDLIKADRSRDAANMLDGMGDPRAFRDSRSTYRWLTNRATVDLMDGHREKGARGYQAALEYAPDDAGAIANSVHATLLLGSAQEALDEAEDALKQHPESKLLWSVRMHARHQLGLDPVDDCIPPEIWNSDDLRYSYAHLLGSIGRHQDAIELMRLCIEESPDTLLYKREFLADTLSHATRSHVLAAFEHLDGAAEKNLVEAVALFEPIEETIYTQQSLTISMELAANLSTALMLLKHNRRAAVLSKNMLKKHPLEDGLLRIQIACLEDEGKATSIKVEVEGHEDQLSTGMLIILLDIATRCSDESWFKCIEEHLVRRPLDTMQVRDVDALRYRQGLSGDNRAQVLTQLREHLAKEPQHAHFAVIAAEALTQDGQPGEALSVIESCLDSNEISGLTDFQLIQLAQQAYRLSAFQIAATCLEPLVRYPSSDELTRKLLFCWIHLGRRAKAWELLERMDNASRSNPNVMRAECELCQLSSDWQRLAQLTENLIEAGDSHIGVILGHAGALHRLGNQEALTSFLAKAWTFSAPDSRYVFELAKLEIAGGLQNIALNRLVVQFSNEPENAEVAGQLMLIRIMVASDIALEPPSTVGTSTAVDLISDIERWTVVIEGSNFPAQSWSEVIAADSDLAVVLLGARAGEVVRVWRGLTEQSATIHTIRSAVEFACEKAGQLLARASDHPGPIWQIPAYKKNGQLNIEMLKASARRTSEIVRIALAEYSKRTIPLAAVSKLLGRGMATLNVIWPSNEYPVWVSSGAKAEISSSMQVIDSYKNRIVVDLFTLTELVRWNVFDEVTAALGQLILSQSSIDQIRSALDSESRFQPVAYMSEHKGNLQLQSVTAAQNAQLFRHLEHVKMAADRCKVIVARGSINASEEMSSAEKYFDRGTVDAIHLCLANDLALLSDDLALRSAHALTGVKNVIGLQSALIAARNSRFLSPNKYSHAIVGKLCANHRFVRISSDDLLATALSDTTMARQQVIYCLQSFSRQELEIVSGLKVALNFIKDVAGKVPAYQVATYAHEALSALVDSRPNLAKPAEQYFARVLHATYGRNGRRLPPVQRRLFGRMLMRSVAFPR